MATYRFIPTNTERVFDAGLVKAYLANQGISAEVSVQYNTETDVAIYVIDSDIDPIPALTAYKREPTAEDKARTVLRNLFPKLRQGTSLTAAETRNYLMALTVLVGE